MWSLKNSFEETILSGSFLRNSLPNVSWSGVCFVTWWGVARYVVANGFLNFQSNWFPFKSSAFGALFQHLLKTFSVSTGPSPGRSDLSMSESLFLSKVWKFRSIKRELIVRLNLFKNSIHVDHACEKHNKTVRWGRCGKFYNRIPYILVPKHQSHIFIQKWSGMTSKDDYSSCAILWCLEKCCPLTTPWEFPNKANHLRNALCQVLKHGDERPSGCESSCPSLLFSNWGFRVACCL